VVLKVELCILSPNAEYLLSVNNMRNFPVCIASAQMMSTLLVSMPVMILPQFDYVGVYSDTVVNDGKNDDDLSFEDVFEYAGTVQVPDEISDVDSTVSANDLLMTPDSLIYDRRATASNDSSHSSSDNRFSWGWFCDMTSSSLQDSNLL